MKPAVYAAKVSDGLYEYGVLRNTWHTVASAGNLWLNGVWIAIGYPVEGTRERRGYAPSMTIARQMMDAITR